MKKTLALLLLTALCTTLSFGQQYKEMIDAGTFTVFEVQEAAEAHFAVVGIGRGTGNKQYRRWEYNALRLMDNDGYLPTTEEKFNEIAKVLKNNNNSRLLDASNWKEVGPTSYDETSGWNPGVGRLTSIVIQPEDQDHIIVGSPTGGIWRTIDGGTNWTPLMDDYVNLKVYSLAIHPTDFDTYFWGSDDGYIFKSTDAGATWAQLANLSGNQVNKILIDPTNPLKMFASINNWGLYRSLDGGTTWSEPNASISTSYDIEFKPGDTNTVYSTGNAFYKSTNGGTTFSQISGAFNGSAKMMGVTPDSPSTLYILEANGSRFNELFKSSNEGASFTDMGHSGTNYFGYSSTGNDTRGQAPRDMDIVVNPNDVDEVHIAGINTWRSLDGGVNFSITSQWYVDNGIGYCHADVDILEYIENPTTGIANLYVGSDGGIHRAADPDGAINSGFYIDLTPGIGVRQFYNLDVSQSNPGKLIGGAQDNGTTFYDATTEEWKDWLGADGMECFIDKNNENIFYGTTQYGSLYKSVDGGENYFGLSEPTSSSGNWITPFDQDPITPNTVYAGYRRVYKSTNGASTWSSISQDFGGNLNHFEIAPSNNQIMFAARGSSLYKTINGGATTWSSVTGFDGSVNDIAIHPTNPNKVAIATTDADRVFVSNNGGSTWTSYQFNLPNFSALALTWQDNGNNGLYVGLNYGVYYIDDNMTQWETYSQNLPNVIINDLEINTSTNTLYAGTYGRGAWKSPAQVTCPSTTTFTAGGWDNGAPTSSSAAVLSYNYDTSSAFGNIDACTLVIEDGVTLTVAADTYVKVENNIFVDGILDVQHQGNVVQVDNDAGTTNAGAISVKISTPNLDSRDFMLLGSPVSAEKRTSVFVDPFLVLNHRTDNFVPHPDVAADFPLAENFADDNGNNWQTYNDAIVPAKGYVVRPQTGYGAPGGVFDYSYELGTLNSGIVEFDVLFNNNKNDSPNILSNPYPSAISADAFINANSMIDEVYFWEHLTPPSQSLPGYGSMNFSMQDISMYNLLGGDAAASDPTGTVTEPNGVIATAQGFAVKANAAGTAKFTNDMRLTSGNNTLRRPQEKDRVWVQVRAVEHDIQSTALIGFVENATEDLDPGYDSRRLASVVSIYSQIDTDPNQQLGIQSLPMLEERRKVALGFSSLIDAFSNYHISMIKREGNRIEQATVYLYDNELEVLTDLTQNGYSFSSNKGTFEGRFSLLFEGVVLANGENEYVSNLIVTPNPTLGEVQVLSVVNDVVSQIDILDMHGRVLETLKPNKRFSTISLEKYASATYLLKIQTDLGTVTKRIVKE